MKTLRRRGQSFVAALMCVCLLMSFVPPAHGSNTPTSAQSTVTISTQGLIVVSKSADVAAPVHNIAADSSGIYDLQMTISGAKGETSWKWTRTEITEHGEAADSEFSDTSEIYSLSNAAKQGHLKSNATYRYTCTATDAKGSSVSGDIKVVTSSEYVHLELNHQTSGITLVGDQIHYLVDLVVGQTSSSAPVYVYLQAAAAGKMIDAERAWQVDLSGAPTNRVPFLDDVQISIPLTPQAMAAPPGSVEVLRYDTSGKVSVIKGVTLSGGMASFRSDTLGVFAVVFGQPASKTATVSTHAGVGGSIFPGGSNLVYAANSSPTLTFFPDEGYRVDRILADGEVVTNTTGNHYTFANISEGTHTLEVYFTKIKPTPAALVLKAQVTGGHGMVQIDADEPGASVSKAFDKAGASASVHFIPDNGYVVDRVYLGGVEVFGITDSFYVGALTGDMTLEATYKLGITPPSITHTVQTAVVSGHGSVSPKTAEVAHGASATFMLVPAPGYHLDYVEVAGKALRVSGSSVRLDNVIAKSTIEVAFAPDVPTYALSATSTPGGTMSPSGTSRVTQGDSVIFNLQADSGFKLEELLVDGADVSSEVENNRYVLGSMNADCAVSAVFVPISPDPPKPTYAVVHAQAGANGAISPAADVRTAIGSPYSFTLLPDAGYRVARVLLDGVDVTQNLQGSTYTIDAVDKDMTLRAEFEVGQSSTPTLHRLRAAASVGGMISPAGTTSVAAGQSISYVLKADAGYKLVALEVDGVRLDYAGPTYTFEDVDAAHTIKAYFEQKPTTPPGPDFISLHARADAGGTISPAGDIRVATGASQMFSFIPNAGYVVDAVRVDGVVVFATGWTYALFDVRAETTLEVSFKKGIVPPPTYHRVHSSASAGGSISPAGGTEVVHGGSLVCAIQADKGYEIASVKVDGVEVASSLDTPTYRFDNITENHEITATFAPLKPPAPQAYWDLRASATSGGKISPTGITKVSAGATQTLYFLPDAGYKVASISIDNKPPMPFSSASYTLFDIGANTSIEVGFEAATENPKPVVFHNVSTEVVAGDDGVAHGSIHPRSSAQVADGGALLISFVPDRGWAVDEVYVDNTLVQKGGTTHRLVNVRADTHVSVSFKESFAPAPTPEYYPLQVVVEGGVGGGVSAGGTFLMAAGASKTFYVYPDAGYTLQGVSANGIDVAAVPCGSGMLAPRLATPSFAYAFSIDNIAEEMLVEVSFTARIGHAPVPIATYEVYAQASSGGSIFASGTHTIPEGMPAEFTLKADVGYHLSSLVQQSTHSEPLEVIAQVDAKGVYVIDEVDNNTTLTATFVADPVVPEKPTYTIVHAHTSAGGAILPAGDTRVALGAAQSFSLIPDAGYELETLSVDGVEVSVLDHTYTLFDLEDEVVLGARFVATDTPVAPAVFEVRASASSGGSISPAGVTKVMQGASLLYTMLPDEGYFIKQVIDDDTDVTSAVVGTTYRARDVVGNRRLQVIFAPIEDTPAPNRRTLTARAGPGGHISPEGNIEVYTGATQTLALLPDAGYVVDTVALDGVDIQTGGTSCTLINIQANHTAEVSFKPAPTPQVFTITATPTSPGGKISPEGSVSVEAGAASSFAFIADAGYKVVSVVVDGEVLPYQPTSYLFDKVQANHTLEVSFGAVCTPGTNPANPLGAIYKQLVRTGDTPVGIWVGIVALFAGGVVCAVWCARRQKRRAHGHLAGVHRVPKHTKRVVAHTSAPKHR